MARKASPPRIHLAQLAIRRICSAFRLRTQTVAASMRSFKAS